jgi:hypothetical protein
MKEDLLQYIWRQKLIPLKNLETTAGEAIQVIHAGRFNTDGGPDFLEAKIRIGDTILAGSVEVHVRTSDWKAHGHQADKKYSNVILHVVYDHDDKSVDRMPTIELNGKIPPILLHKYRQLADSKAELPCEPFWKDVDAITMESFKERLAIERLERKSVEILEWLRQQNNDWLQVTYRLLGKYFGGPVNHFAWDALVSKLDYKILLKHADDVFQLEALLFGVAGFLSEPADEYALRLRKEFEHLQLKYGLTSLPLHYWNFLRIRPPGFPTIRLALFAQLIHRMPQFTVLADFRKAAGALGSLHVSGYWEEHYVFGKRVDKQIRNLGRSTVQMLLLNVCIPLQYAYARNIRQHDRLLEAVELLYTLPAEENRKTKLYAGLIDGVETAYDSQSVIELYDQYCVPRRCLYCRIGHQILQGNIRLQYKCSEPDPEQEGELYI